MAAVDRLTATGYVDALATAARVLEDHAVALDRLGAPSPDQAAGRPADPAAVGIGSDLAATLSSAVTAAEGCSDFASASAALVEGARAAASGRAGRGAATLLSGIGEVLRNADHLDGTRFALALEAGAELLAPAADGRHPGGFASVVAETADAALSACDRGADLADVLVAAADAGVEELERGPVADERLARRGVVDASSAGFLLVLDTLGSVVTGEPLPARPPEADAPEVGPSTPQFRVSCRLLPDDPGPQAAAHLEDVLREMADIGTWETDGGAWRVGLTTTLPGAAVEALTEVGRPRELHIGVVVDPSLPGSTNGSVPQGSEGSRAAERRSSGPAGPGGAAFDRDTAGTAAGAPG